jgi:hypothetical protein
MVCKRGQLSDAGTDVLGLPEEHAPMIPQNSFVRRYTDGCAYDSICLDCLLTVSAVQGGANLREMEMRHKCDPMKTIPSQKIREVVVSIDGGIGDYLFDDRSSEDFLSAPGTAEADRKKILKRLRKYCQREGLSIIRRVGRGSSG